MRPCARRNGCWQSARGRLECAGQAQGRGRGNAPMQRASLHCRRRSCATALAQAVHCTINPAGKPAGLPAALPDCPRALAPSSLPKWGNTAIVAVSTRIRARTIDQRPPEPASLPVPSQQAAASSACGNEGRWRQSCCWACSPWPQREPAELPPLLPPALPPAPPPSRHVPRTQLVL